MLKYLALILSKTKTLTNVMMGSTKMAILVRTDLKMGRGKIASQVAHAAVLLYQSSEKSQSPCLKWWLINGQPKIVLKIETDCENVLKKVYSLAKEENLNVCIVRDAGRTQISSGTVTAVGVGPNETEKVDKIISNFKLL